MNSSHYYSSPFDRNGLGAIPGGTIEGWIPGLLIAGAALVLLAILKKPKRRLKGRVRKAVHALVA